MQECHTAWAVFSLKWDHDHPNEAILLREMWSDLQHELFARAHANSFYPPTSPAHSQGSSAAVASSQSFRNPTSPLRPSKSVLGSAASPGRLSQSATGSDGSAAGSTQQADPKPATLSALAQYNRKIAMSTPQGSPHSTPTKRALGADGVQLSYTTIKSRMYATEVPADVDMLLGSEECGGSHGKWIKFWIKVRDKLYLEKFSRVMHGMPPLKVYDEAFPLYKGCWVPTPTVLELYKESVQNLAASLRLKTAEDFVEFSPEFIPHLEVAHLENNHFRLSGSVVFLKIMYTNEYSFNYNTSIVQNESDNSIECDGQAKDIFMKLAMRIDMPIQGDV